MKEEQNIMIQKTGIGDIILSESGDFIDLLYNETTRQAQEKARKIECEITKKIRQEAIDEFRKELCEKLDEKQEAFSGMYWQGYYDCIKCIKYYNLPTK